MAAANLKRIGAGVALAVLVLSLIAIPGSNGVVVADAMSGGHPIIPPPDTTEVTVCPGGDVSPWTEISVLISTVSSMIL